MKKRIFALLLALVLALSLLPLGAAAADFDPIPNNLANRFLNGNSQSLLGPQKFNFNGQNLYVSLAEYRAEQNDYVACRSSIALINPDEEDPTALPPNVSKYCVAIFEEQNGSYLPITDEGLLEDILDAYVFSLTIYSVDKEGYVKPKGNPTVADISAENIGGWPCGKSFTVDFKNVSGTWAFYTVMTSKSNPNQTVESMSVSQLGIWENKFESINSTNIEDINNRLSDITASIGGYANEFVYVTLPEGVIEGEIVIPEVKGTAGIELRGVFDPSFGDIKTTLHGSIRTEGPNADSFYGVRYLNMKGAGKNAETFADGRPNYGIYGTAECNCNDCVLSDYYHARHAEGNVLAWNGESTYTDNHVAIYMDSPSCTIGNYNMYRAKFIENDIAIQLEKFSKTTDMKKFNTSLTCFIGNGIDVVNNSGRILWIDYNFFYHSDHTAGTGNSVSHSDGNPNLSGIFYESNCVLISKASKASSHTTPHGKDIPAVVVNHFAASPEIAPNQDDPENVYDEFTAFYTADDLYGDINDLSPIAVPESSLNVIDSDGKWYYGFDFGEDLN